MAQSAHDPVVVRVSPIDRTSEGVRAELRRILGPGKVVTLGPNYTTADEIASKVRELQPDAVLLDLATPPHTTLIRTLLADEYPILTVTVELRDVPEHGGVRRQHVTAIALRTAIGDVEHLADGALDPRGQ